MAIFNLRFYAVNPSDFISDTIGALSTWNGGGVAGVTATVTDNQTGVEGEFLSDGFTGETATADLSGDGVSFTGAGIETERVHLVRDTTTDQIIRIYQISVNAGEELLTLADTPLVEGRTYQTLALDTSPTSGENSAFSYETFADGTITGTAGDDVIDRDFTGDPNGDRVDANDSFTSQTEQASFVWSDLPAGDVAGASATQTVAGIDVTVSADLSPTATLQSSSVDTIFIPADSAISDTSSAQLRSEGDAEETTLSIDFDAAPGSGRAEEVQNVQFVITDIDGLIAGATDFQDIVTIDAFDAAGNAVPVTIEVLGNDTLSGNTVIGALDSDQIDEPDGAIVVTIAGPVDRVQVTYDNGGSTPQLIRISDIQFDAVTEGGNDDDIFAGAGNDSVFAGAGDDTVEGAAGQDTIDGGTGNDSLSGGRDADVVSGGAGNDTILGGGGRDTLSGGAGDDSLSGGGGGDTFSSDEGNDTLSGQNGPDTFTYSDGFGNDVVQGGEGGTDNDVIDLSGLSGPVTVTYTSDEAGVITDGTDTITFTGIERLILTDFDDVVQGAADTAGLNIDAGDGDDTIVGGAGDDTLIGGAGSDSLSGGDGADDLSGGAGNDTLSLGLGDTARGDDGDDLFRIDDVVNGSGPISITGGEGGETNGDRLENNGMIAPGSITLTNTDDANGGLGGTSKTTGDETVTFDQVESVVCFVDGTRIATPNGLRAVEALREGDLVLTRDAGPQPLQWIGRMRGRVSATNAPIRFAPGAIGNTETLRISPQHRVLVRGWRAQLFFGESELLVPARALIDGDRIRAEAAGHVGYHHLMTPQHQILFSEGAETESFLPAAVGLEGVSQRDRARLFLCRPELRADLSIYGPTSRVVPRLQDARLLLA